MFSIICDLKKSENIFFTVYIIGYQSTSTTELQNVVKKENFTGRCDKYILFSNFMAKLSMVVNEACMV